MGKFDTKFDSAKQNWETPQQIFNFFDNIYHFQTDLAADELNHKCPHYFTEKDNVLSLDWVGNCWLNPPYGNKAYKLKDWIIKCYNESQTDDCIVAILIPARTNTSWWHNYCMKANTIYFLNGRPKFIERTQGYPQPCKHGLPQPLAVIIFKKSNESTKLLSLKI
jgi:site-specific DNA-methyltransferase (adenine-specific)